MTQKLVLPINKCKLTASWKTDSYFNKFGFVHYGSDMVSTAGSVSIYASGDGEVVAAGSDNVVGNVVAVKYTQAENHATGQAKDVIFRYFHLASIAVKTGDKVSKDKILGNYGNTGSMPMANHLHLEADTDIGHPLYSPTVLSSNFIKGRSAGANDNTMTNPLEWLYCKTDAQDSQTYATAGDSYIRTEDKRVSQITGALTSEGIRIEGVDVSAHNGTVDWNKVKKAGKEFAFIRVGWAGWDGAVEKNGGLDRLFRQNMKSAVAAGLHVGVYVYSYCKTPEAARIAASETLELVKPYNLDYPIAFDIEDTSDSGTRYDKMSRAANSEIAEAFLSVVKNAGYHGILYTYKDFAERYLDMDALSGWDVWIAQYAGLCTYNGAYAIWQYAGETGKCDGVAGACDLNASYKDYAAIIGKTAQAPAPVISEADRLSEENAEFRQEIISLTAINSALEARLEKARQALA